MSVREWQPASVVSLASDVLRGFVDKANDPVPADAVLRSNWREELADYLEAVRDRRVYPPHAFSAGFFMDAFPTSQYARRASEMHRPDLALAPVAPVDQTAPLADHAAREPLWRKTMPDDGRRIQQWWDELLPGQPPLRADEVVRFVRRGQWLGEVERIEADRFEATLRDRNVLGLVERATFYRSDVALLDRARLQIGAQFYWTVGFMENVIGERTAASRLRFRRMPVATPERIVQAADIAPLLDLPPGPNRP